MRFDGDEDDDGEAPDPDDPRHHRFDPADPYRYPLMFWPGTADTLLWTAFHGVEGRREALVRRARREVADGSISDVREIRRLVGGGFPELADLLALAERREAGGGRGAAGGDRAEAARASGDATGAPRPSGPASQEPERQTE